MPQNLFQALTQIHPYYPYPNLNHQLILIPFLRDDNFAPKLRKTRAVARAAAILDRLSKAIKPNWR